MAIESGQGHGAPSWFVGPGEMDSFAWVALGFMLLAIYGLVTLYAAFDRWAEHKSKGTPLAKTIPTMLAIALLYEIFPLGHFNILLPLAAILIALMADWSRFNLTRNGGGGGDGGGDALATAPAAPLAAEAAPPAAEAATPVDPAPLPGAATEAPRNV